MRLDINKIFKWLKNNWISLFSIFFLISIWQLTSIASYKNSSIWGSPLGIINSLVSITNRPDIVFGFGYSLSAQFLGLFLAITTGVFVGILISQNKALYHAIRPYVYFLDMIPMLVFLPLILVWFGLGIGSEVAAVFMMTVVTIIINTYEGANRVDVQFRKMAQSFGGSRLFIVKKIVLPSALPEILVGIKMAVLKSSVAIIVSEFFGLSGGKGVGYLISYYGATFKINEMFALIAVFVCTNFILIKIIDKIERLYLLKYV